MSLEVMDQLINSHRIKLKAVPFGAFIDRFTIIKTMVRNQILNNLCSKATADACYQEVLFPLFSAKVKFLWTLL
jgi:hypothetical protein